MEQQHAGSGPSVATGATNFLIIGLQTSRNVEMDDQPDIRLIDAHAEGIRRSQNPHSPPAKVVMHESPFLIRETGMVVADRLVRLSQPFRNLLHRPSRGAIDQDRAFLRLANQTLRRRQFLLAGLAKTNRQSEIGPTETRDQSERIAERQPFAQ